MVDVIVDVEGVVENGVEDVVEVGVDVEADDIVDDVTVRSGAKQLTYKSASTSGKKIVRLKPPQKSSLGRVFFSSNLSYFVYQ